MRFAAYNLAPLQSSDFAHQTKKFIDEPATFKKEEPS